MMGMGKCLLKDPSMGAMCGKQTRAVDSVFIYVYIDVRIGRYGSIIKIINHPTTQNSRLNECPMKVGEWMGG